MRKLLYIIVLTLSASLFLASCTEETVKPADANSGGGVVSDPIK